MYTIEATRRALQVEYENNSFRGNTVELRGWTISLDMSNDRHSIIGEPNEKYIAAEIQWYTECDRRVDRLAEIYGKRVQIWDNIADSTGQVNSNYGWCIYSNERGNQYWNAVKALVSNNLTRQATMIYQHPDMHKIAGKDFTCTNAVHYYLVDDPIHGQQLDVLVQMRSNDAVYGFNNDYAWQHHVASNIVKDLRDGFIEVGHYQHDPIDVTLGRMYWQAASLHVYDRHFHLLEV